MKNKKPFEKAILNTVEKEKTTFFSIQKNLIQGEFSRWVFCIVGTLLLYGIVAFIVSKVYRPDTQAMIDAAKEISFLQDFNPEPVERLLYMLGILIAPLSLFFLYTLFLKKAFNTLFEKRGLFYTLMGLTVVAIIGLFYVTFNAPNPFYAEAGSSNLNMHDVKAATNFDFYFYGLTQKSFWIYIAVVVPLLLLLYFFVFSKLKGTSLKVSNFIISLGGYSISALLVFAVVKMNMYDFPMTWQAQFDLNAVYYSVTQVYGGSQMLINHFTNTYGLYPHFLQPIFEISGLSVHSFTTVMSILIGICFVSIFIFMRKFVADKLLLFLGFISTLYLPYIYNRLVTDFDSYFALFPIRILPVGLVLLFAALWFIIKNEKWKKVMYYLGTILLPFGILWNPDFGMIAVISWIALFVYTDFYTEDKKIAWKKIAIHLATGIIAIFVAFAIYSILQKMMYGSFPQISLMFSTLIVFSELGYFMLPMSLIHIWMIPVLCFTIGLTYSISCFVRKKITPKSAAIFLVSVLGFGTFAYFQGRSHNWNLMPSFLFLFICLTLLLDELWKTIKENNVKPLYVIFAIGLFCLTFSTLNVFEKSKEINTLVQHDFDKGKKKTANSEKRRIRENVKFLDERIDDSKKILVFTTNKFQGLYFDGKKKRSAVNPAFIELFFRSDIQRYINTIQDADYKVFYDPAGFYYHYGEGIRAAMAANYVIKDCLYDTTAVVFTYLEKQTKEIPEKSFFPSHEKTLFYEKFSNDSLGTAKRIAAATGYPNVEKSESYTIEFLLFPEKQLIGATIISNSTDTSGFFINFQPKDAGNHYDYLMGFGGRGYYITLDSGKWNYVVLEISKNIMAVYVNGKQMLRSALGIEYVHDDNAKLFIGNLNTRRNYFGLISEVAITNGIISPSEVTARWNLIKEINP